MALPFKPAGGGAAIGSVVTGLTAGSVPYGDTGGVLAQDNANMRRVSYNSDVSLRLGVSNDSAINAALDAGIGVSMTLVLSNTQLGANGMALLTQAAAGNGTDGYFGHLSMRGTITSPTAVQTGDALMFFPEVVYNGSTWGYSGQTGWTVDGTVTAGQRTPLRYGLWTAASDGNLYERARITSQGTKALATPSASSTIATAGKWEHQAGKQNWVSTASASVTLSVGDCVLHCTTGTAGITLTLPSAMASLAGLTFFVTKVDSGASAITVSANGADTLNGALTKTVSNQWDTARIICHASGAWVLNRYSAI